jgi:hypothetical protein
MDLTGKRSSNLLSSQAPEWGGETELGKEGFGLIDRSPPPSRLPSVGAVPRLRQAPAPVEGENFATGQIPVPAPLLDVLF